MSSLFPLVLRAFAPPRTLLANFLWFEHKTSVITNCNFSSINNLREKWFFMFIILDLNDIEEKFANQIGGGRVGLL